VGGKTKQGEKLLVILLLHVDKLIHDRLRVQMADMGIHRGQGQVLRVLGNAKAKSISQSELAGRMQKLVKRQRDTGDDRVVRVELTKLGQKMSAKTRSIMRKIEKEVISDIADKDLKQLHRLLLKIRDGLGGRAPFAEDNGK